MALCTCDFKRPEPSAATRPINTKVAESDVSVRDWGAVGNGSTNDRGALLAATTEVPIGSTLSVPPGQYLTTTGQISQTRDFSWRLDPGATLREYAPSASYDALQVNILGQGESRGMTIEGGYFQSFKTDATAFADQNELYSRGNYGISVNADTNAAPMVHLKISDAIIGGGAGAILFSGPGGRDSVFFSGADHCTLNNGVVLNKVSDGTRFTNIMSSGKNPAFTLDALPGAFNHTFEGGTSGNRRGALDVINGSFWKLLNMQIEHGFDNIEVNPDWDGTTLGSGGQPTTFNGGNPPSSNHYFRIAANDLFAPGAGGPGASVYVRGSSYESVGGQIMGCHLGAGDYVKYSIAVQNARGTVIDENYFNVTTIGGSDVLLAPTARDTVIGTRNQFRGLESRRPRQPIGSPTDASRRLKVEVGSTTAVSARGLWQPASSVLTAVQSGWTISGMEVMLTETGMVVFNGGMVGGATTGNICTFPAWLRPATDARIHVATNQGVVRALKLAASTGVLSILGTLPTSDINFANATFAAVLNADYPGLA